MMSLEEVEASMRNQAKTTPQPAFADTIPYQQAYLFKRKRAIEIVIMGWE